MRSLPSDTILRAAAAPLAWLAAAVAVAGASVLFAVADVPGLSILLAVLGLPLCAYAALAAPSRVWIAVGVAAVAANLVVFGYWAYALFDTLQGVR